MLSDEGPDGRPLVVAQARRRPGQGAQIALGFRPERFVFRFLPCHGSFVPGQADCRCQVRPSARRRAAGYTGVARPTSGGLRVEIRDVSAPDRLITPARGAALLVIGILMLAFNLRSAITSLPPVFPELQSALHISDSGLALLAAIPVLCFGVFSGTAAPLSRRFGEERVLGAALLLLAAGLLLRGLSPTALLFPGTVVAGGAIALMNVLLPSLVKRRM